MDIDHVVVVTTKSTDAGGELGARCRLKLQEARVLYFTTVADQNMWKTN